MASIKRPLADRALHFRLGDDAAALVDGEPLARSGRSARTLVKDGALRVTLVALAPGGAIAPHRADGALTVHVVSGRVRFVAGAEEWPLVAGDLLALAAGVEHAVDSEDGGVFLLSVVAAPRPGGAPGQP